MGIERAGDLFGSEMLVKHRVQHHAAEQEGHALQASCDVLVDTAASTSAPPAAAGSETWQ